MYSSPLNMIYINHLRYIFRKILNKTYFFFLALDFQETYRTALKTLYKKRTILKYVILKKYAIIIITETKGHYKLYRSWIAGI